MATHADTPVPAPPLPDLSGDRFRVMDWHVFTPGYHKNNLYTRDDCKQIVANFQKYSTGENAYIKPVGKLGHDDKQSIKLSLGLPAVGRITACRSTPDGGFAIDVEKIHREGVRENGETFDLYEQVLNGGYPTGSVEIEPNIPDPIDPSKTIPGYVLTGVAFLGEEAPGIAGLPSPKAIFNRYSKEVIPVRDDIIQQLRDLGVPVDDPSMAGKSDDELQTLLTTVSSPEFMAAMQAKFAAQPDATPTVPDAPVQMAANGGNVGAMEHYNPRVKDDDGDTIGYTRNDKLRASAGCDQDDMPVTRKEFAAMQQAMQAMKPSDKDLAAFSRTFNEDRAARHRTNVQSVVEQACREGRLTPADKADQMEIGMARSQTVTFSAGKENAGKTPFDVWKTKLLSRPKDFRFSAIEDPMGSADSQEMAQLKEFTAKAETSGVDYQAKVAHKKLMAGV